MTKTHIVALDDFGGLQTLFSSYVAYVASQGEKPNVINRASAPPLRVFKDAIERSGARLQSPKDAQLLRFARKLPLIRGKSSIRPLEAIAMNRALKKLGRADRNTVVAWNALPSRKLVNTSDLFIVYDHGLSSIQKPRLENRQKLSLASSIVCISRANEILLRERWDWQGKTSVVMNPLRGQLADAPLPETPRSLPNGLITLGCTARLVSFKGIASAIHALAILRKRFDVRLKIAGDGEEMENLRTTSIRLGLEDFVEFSGLIEDVPAFLQSVDIFLAPSLREPFGLSPLEAMAMGIPTVLTAVDGHADVLPFPGAATLLEPTLSLDKYQALGASKRRMPLFVYSPLTNELVPPKALDPESLAVAIEDILNSFADHAQTALEAGRQIRIRNSMAKYVSSLNIALAK